MLLKNGWGVLRRLFAPFLRAECIVFDLPENDKKLSYRNIPFFRSTITIDPSVKNLSPPPL